MNPPGRYEDYGMCDECGHRHPLVEIVEEGRTRTVCRECKEDLLDRAEEEA